MSNKGFTLVELLAVIVILSLLTLLTSNAVTKILKDSKEDLSNTQFSAIKSAAEIWGSENINELPAENECKYLTLKDLKEFNLIGDSVKDPNTNKEMSEDLKIKITTSIGKKGNLITLYEVIGENETLDNCNPVYEKEESI